VFASYVCVYQRGLGVRVIVRCEMFDVDDSHNTHLSALDLPVHSHQPSTMGAKPKAEAVKTEFLNACSFSHEKMRRLALGSEEDRIKATVPIEGVTSDMVLTVQPMKFYEQAACVLFLLLAVPNGIISIPLLTFLIGRFIMGNVTFAFQILAVLMTPLVVLPQEFVPSVLTSWLAAQVLKYFSFRFIMEGRPPTQTLGDSRPQILVAPPHGVFPYGNLLAMLVWPILTGHHFLGLAANSAVRIPVFKQILKSMGVVDASRETARKSLESSPYTIGISTGGVAEVFETNAGGECVILKERIGLIKLAIRTGADLVPW
jgi:hypothetical protein